MLLVLLNRWSSNVHVEATGYRLVGCIRSSVVLLTPHSLTGCTADARLNQRLHVCKIDLMIARSLCMKPRMWKQCIYRCHSVKHSSSRDTTDRLKESLRSLLHMPLGSAEQVATAAPVVDSCDLHVALENLQLLAAYFPRSSFRSLEKLVAQNPLVLVTPLAPWRDFLAAYGVSEQAFCGIIMWQAAAIITSSTSFQAGTVILTLQNWGLSSTHINKSVLLRAPQVLLLQQPCLQTLYSFLNGVCLLSADRIRDLVVASPHVLLQDVQDDLQPRVAMLQQVSTQRCAGRKPKLQEAATKVTWPDLCSRIPC